MKSPCFIPPNAPERRIIKSRPGAAGAGRNLLDYLSGRFDYRSRGEWSAALDNGEFLVNGLPASGEVVLAPEDVVEWLPGEIPEPEVDFSWRELYCDGQVLAVAKSGNLPTHPAGAYFRNTLWYELRRRYGEIHPVNRLDRETSGVVLLALNVDAAARLQRSLPSMKKEYLLLVEGLWRERGAVTISGWLRRDDGSAVRKKQRLYPEPPGREAVTEFRFLAAADGVSKLAVHPLTGRTHQIRASALSAGYPVVGDKLYGVDERLYLKQSRGELTEADMAGLRMRRQALHASALEFPHPETGEIIRVEAPEPEDFPVF